MTDIELITLQKQNETLNKIIDGQNEELIKLRSYAKERDKYLEQLKLAEETIVKNRELNSELIQLISETNELKQQYYTLLNNIKMEFESL